jgi:hypothetical protein
MLIRRILILFLAFFAISSLVAQDNALLRVELPAVADEYPYHLVSLRDKGFIVFYKTKEKEENNSNWYFDFYDVNLKKETRSSIPLNEDLAFKHDFIRNDTLFILFQEESKKGPGKKYSVLIMDPENKNHKIINGVFSDEGSVVGFWMHGSVAYFNFYVEDEYATILMRELNSEKTKDYFYEDRDVIEIDQLTISDDSGLIDLILSRRIDKKTDALYYYSLSSEGNIVDSTMLSSGSGEKKLNMGMLYTDEDGEKVIIGTYLLDEGKSSGKKNETNNESSGLFFTKLINNTQPVMKFYSYLDFKNFSVYISDNELLKYQRQAKRMEKKGKDFSINYKLLVHDIVRKNDQYIFAAESYYPEFHTVSYMTYDYYGRPVPQYYSVFDGYRYTSALIAAFDTDGNVLWSNMFDLFKILSRNLKQRVNYFFDEDDIVLSYAAEGKIASKIINGEKVVGKLDYSDIATGMPRDEIESDKRSEMERWYGNYFLVYGYQTIKNISSDKRRRTVFYVNKIAFQ